MPHPMSTVGLPRQESHNAFLDYLLAQGLLDQKRADAVIREGKRSGRMLEELLVEGNILSEEELYTARARFYGVAFRDVPPEFSPPKEVLRLIPEDAMQTYHIVPLAREGSVLEVGMLAPEDRSARDALRFIAVRAELTPQSVQISLSAFRRIQQQYTTLGGEVREALKELEQTLSEEQPPRVSARRRKAEEIAGEEAPIIKTVAVIIKHAVEGRASDIHIEPTADKLRVRFRVDGVLYTSLFLPKDIHPAVLARVKILSNLKIDETRIPQDGRFRTLISGKDIDFRVATYPTAFGEKAALRILDPTIGLKTFPELGLEGRNLKFFEAALQRPYGMVLVTGPTGSGKSTTLYAALKNLNTDAVNIVTLEDPVEYFIEGINQSQVHEEIGYTFAEGLRHILRGDPNIIMVGEIRDTETAQLAVHGALTGHVVLSTLHTNNAPGVIPRLLDMQVDAFLIPSTLHLAVAQRLVQKLCSHCKEAHDVSEPERRLLASALKDFPEEERAAVSREPLRVWRSPGCARCGHRGTSGRIALFEMVAMTPELENIVVRRGSGADIQREAQRQGMVTMFQDGIKKALRGIVGLEEVLRVAKEPSMDA